MIHGTITTVCLRPDHRRRGSTRPWTGIANALKTDCETRPAGTLRLRPACSTLILIPAIGLQLSAAATFRVGGTDQTPLD